MINLYNTQLENIFVHKLGNKAKNEGLYLSELALPYNDEIEAILKEYFLKPFRKTEESFYNFTHDVDVEFNEVYNACTEIFFNPTNLEEQSKVIAKHLYNQGSHPHIKSGEIYVVYMKNLQLNNEKVDGIGIFKSEIKKDFMNFAEGTSRLEMELRQGIDLSKLDKGCIVFNVEKEQGYKVMSVDSNRYDTKYWLEHFLDLEVFRDENFLTKKYVKMIQDFGKDIIGPAEDKLEQISFQNRAVNHLAKTDDFIEDNFLNEILGDNNLLKDEFRNYKEEKGGNYGLEDCKNFEVSNTAVTEARKKLKNNIKLDTNMEIKINFTNPDSFAKYVEKGWDEERQQYYYLLYFNKEEK